MIKGNLEESGARGSLIGNLIEGLLALSTVIVFVFSTWPVVMGI